MIISGQKILLKPFCFEDINEQYLRWLSDNEVMQYSNQRFVKHSLESCMLYLENFKNSDNLFLAIKLKENNKLVGTTTAYISFNHLTADLGLLIGDKSLWGEGLGSDTWLALTSHLFNEVGIRKITAGTLRNNIGMVRVIEKIGMHLEGVKKRHEIVDGTEQDILLYAKFS